MRKDQLDDPSQTLYESFVGLRYYESFSSTGYY